MFWSNYWIKSYSFFPVKKYKLELYRQGDTLDNLFDPTAPHE